MHLCGICVTPSLVSSRRVSQSQAKSEYLRAVGKFVRCCGQPMTISNALDIGFSAGGRTSERRTPCIASKLPFSLFFSDGVEPAQSLYPPAVAAGPVNLGTSTVQPYPVVPWYSKTE